MPPGFAYSQWHKSKTFSLSVSKGVQWRNEDVSFLDPRCANRSPDSTVTTKGAPAGREENRDEEGKRMRGRKGGRGQGKIRSSPISRHFSNVFCSVTKRLERCPSPHNVTSGQMV